MLRRFTNTRLEYRKWFAFIVVAFCFVYILRQKLPEKASVLDHNISRKPQNDNEVKAQAMDDPKKYVSKRLSKIKQNCGDVCKTDHKIPMDSINLGRFILSELILKPLLYEFHSNSFLNNTLFSR